MRTSLLPSLANEMANADLGDLRLTKRLPKIVAALAARPGEGLPRAMANRAALEAAYRFMSNERVTPDLILRPHIAATRQRAIEAKRIVAIHDTTESLFGGERDGLGRVNGSKTQRRGFFMHVALAVDPRSSQPLGTLGMIAYARGRRVPKNLGSWALSKRATKESDRWTDLVRTVDASLADQVEVIHVTDREGDQFRVMDEAIHSEAFFVIRAMHKDRGLAPNDAGFHNLDEATAVAPVLFERRVHLSPRKGKHFRYWTNQPREGRPARLQVSATSVHIQRSRMLRPELTTADALRVNIVRVVEMDPPKGAERVEWVLLTNLPIDTPDQVGVVIDSYRQRWLIEEYFKAIKTGCNYEKLQLESAKTLVNALALLMPVAWQMLLLRSLSRSDSTFARDVLTPIQLEALRALSSERLPANPTAKEALLAIAAMGGHIKNNGDPGWIVLYRGFRDLTLAERVWALRSDQS